MGLPPGSQGQAVCLVCVCTFSKFVVAKSLPDKTSASVARAFYEFVLCDFGVPQSVRCDNGLEFRGEFADLL